MAAAAIPAIGAVAGAAMAKKSGQNPLLGAALGGVGGHFAGPMLGGLGAAQGAASPAIAALGTGPEAMAAQGVAMEAMAGGVNPAMAAQMAGMSPQATSALANPMASGLIGTPQGAGGLLGGIGKKQAVMAGGNMMLKGMQPNQPMPQPMPMPVQQRQQTRSMMSLANQPQGLGSNINFKRNYI